MATNEILQSVFSTEERVRILSMILRGGAINIPSTARSTKTNKGLVSKYCQILLSLGVLKKVNSKYTLNLDSPLTRSIKVVLNMSKMDMPLPNWIKNMGVYGSYAKGTNSEESDIDIWIVPKTSVDHASVGDLENRITKKLGNEAHIIILTKDRLDRLKKEDVVFYHSLVFGSFIIKGDSLESIL